MNITAEIYYLSREDVTAFRMAEGVSFHVHEGAAYIRPSLRERFGGEPRIYTYLVAVQVGPDNTARMVRQVN